MMIECPQCNSLSTIPIVYGKPGLALDKAASHGLVELGGCVVEDGSPTQRCIECNHAWRETVKSLPDSAAEQKLNRIKYIINNNLFEIYTGMASASIFQGENLLEEESFVFIYDYLELKSILEVPRGDCTLEGIASVHRFKNKHPSIYKAVKTELHRQVCIRSLGSDGAFEGLHYQLFQACMLMFNTSPMSSPGLLDNYDEEEMKKTVREYINEIKKGAQVEG